MTLIDISSDDETETHTAQHPGINCTAVAAEHLQSLVISPRRHSRTKPTNQYPAKETPLRLQFRDMHDMAVVVVGPKESKFVLHSHLLTSVSPFFAAALNGSFAESSSRTITLPDERPEIFEWFVQWLYSGTLRASTVPCSPTSSNTARLEYITKDVVSKGSLASDIAMDGDLRNSAGMPKYFLLIDIYGLSDRLMTTALSNHIIDTVARLSETTNSVPTPSDTWLLYGDCSSFSGLNHCSCRDNSLVASAAHCPSLAHRSSNPGLRTNAPLRDLMLDLFVYKKTDKLLSTHKDDWHPLFIRDLVVRLKRPGRDTLARHCLIPWRPSHWPDSQACDACRSLVGPLHPEDMNTRAAASRHGGDLPSLVYAMRCTECKRVYCESCINQGVIRGGLETGDAKFALVGADIGPCKPWLRWDPEILARLKPGEERKGARTGVCGRYHEHGPLAGGIKRTI